MQKVYFFFDDSGVLHENEQSGFFVYAGYVFVGESEKANAQRRYRKLVKNIKQANNLDGELKAFGLENKHKRSLVKVLSQYESVSATVEIKRVYPYILSDKLSRFRYKDYILKRIIKMKIQDLISHGVISADEDLSIKIFIDEQHTATNGWYDLKESITEELTKGISNFNYGHFYPPILNAKLSVSIKYCDSKYNYLIQASDLLANYIWHQCINPTQKIFLNKHFRLRLP